MLLDVEVDVDVLVDFDIEVDVEELMLVDNNVSVLVDV